MTHYLRVKISSSPAKQPKSNHKKSSLKVNSVDPYLWITAELSEIWSCQGNETKPEECQNVNESSELNVFEVHSVHTCAGSIPAPCAAVQFQVLNKTSQTGEVENLGRVTSGDHNNVRAPESETI